MKSKYAHRPAPDNPHLRAQAAQAASVFGAHPQRSTFVNVHNRAEQSRAAKWWQELKAEREKALRNKPPMRREPC